MNKAIDFVKQSIGELKKSTWLSRREVAVSTFLVGIVVVLVSLYVAVLDWGLTGILGKLVGGR